MRLSLKKIEPSASLASALTGFLLTVLMLLLYVAQPPLLIRTDLSVYDLFLPLRAAPAPSPVPVIIDLDEASLAEHGQWPWSRYLVADLLDALTEYGVAAIGMDIMFAEADRTSPERMQEALRRDKQLAVTYSGIPPEFADYDLILARALQRSPAVIGAFASFADDVGEIPTPATGVIEREKKGAIPWRELIPEAKGAILPLSSLRKEAPPGFINSRIDPDGIVREIPLIVRIGEDIHPSLSLRTLMRGLDVRDLTLEAGPYGLEAVRLGNRPSIPVSQQGMLRIPFIGPRETYPYFSVADVLARRIPQEALEGRVAFVGTSLAGLMDIRAMPYDSAYPGVEIHAAAVDVMLAGNDLGIPSWTPGAQAGIILLAGILSTLAFGFARPRVYLPVLFVLMGAIVLTSRHLFGQGIFLSPLYGLLTVAVLGGSLLLIRFWQEERQKKKLRGIFSRYVSPEVVNQVTRQAEDLMAGEERELSIMFTDIRSFTTLSEKLKPEEVVSLLNYYFSPMTALVRKHSGTLDKFIGDALMAYWNAPLDVADHSRKAVETALAMQEALPLVNERLRADLNLEISIGVGVHTGRAFVGNMGTSDFINYTLIGDSVNLASRLEGLCPVYGVGIAVSGEVKKACGDAFAWQFLDSIRVKGKTQPVDVYLPLRLEEAELRRDELALWEQAREMYAAEDFAAAGALLTTLCNDFPERKLYAVFAGKVSKHLAESLS